MAKQNDGDINKSEEIRKYLRKHPEAGAATIIPEFAKRGIEVKKSLVSGVKQDMKKKGDLPGSSSSPAQSASPQKTAKKKTARKTSQAAEPKTSQKATVSTPAKAADLKPVITAEDLKEAKKLVNELGGIEQVRRALKYLEELS